MRHADSRGYTQQLRDGEHVPMPVETTQGNLSERNLTDITGAAASHPAVRLHRNPLYIPGGVLDGRLSWLVRASSYLQISTRQWISVLLRNGFSIASAVLLVLFAKAFYDLTPTEREICVNDLSNPFVFYCASVLNISGDALLNFAAFLFSDAYPTSSGFRLADGIDPRQVYCGDINTVAIPFQDYLKIQRFTGSFTYLPDTSGHCPEPGQQAWMAVFNGTLPAGLDLGIPMANAYERSLNILAVFTWMSLIVALTLFFANPRNEAIQTQLMEGLIGLSIVVLKLPFSMALTLSIFLFNGLFNSCCYLPSTRRFQERIQQIWHDLIFWLSNRFGDNAVTARLARDNGNVETLSAGCLPIQHCCNTRSSLQKRYVRAMQVSFSSQLRVLGALGLRLPGGLHHHTHAQVLVSLLREVEERCNALARRTFLTEFEAFGPLFEKAIALQILDYRQSLVREKSPGLDIPRIDKQSLPASLLDKCQREIDNMNKTLSHANRAQKDPLIEQYFAALKNCVEDVFTRLWLLRMKELIVKHFTSLNLPRLRFLTPAERTIHLNGFRDNLIKHFPVLWSILIIQGYRATMQALNLNIDWPTLQTWPQYFKAIYQDSRSDEPKVTTRADQDKALPKTIVTQLAWLYTGGRPQVLQSARPILQQPPRRTLTDLGVYETGPVRAAEASSPGAFSNPMYDALRPATQGTSTSQEWWNPAFDPHGLTEEETNELRCYYHDFAPSEFYSSVAGSQDPYLDVAPVAEHRTDYLDVAPEDLAPAATGGGDDLTETFVPHRQPSRFSLHSTLFVHITSGDVTAREDKQGGVQQVLRLQGDPSFTDEEGTPFETRIFVDDGAPSNSAPKLILVREVPPEPAAVLPLAADATTGAESIPAPTAGVVTPARTPAMKLAPARPVTAMTTAASPAAARAAPPHRAQGGAASMRRSELPKLFSPEGVTLLIQLAKHRNIAPEESSDNFEDPNIKKYIRHLYEAQLHYTLDATTSLEPLHDLLRESVTLDREINGNTLIIGIRICHYVLTHQVDAETLAKARAAVQEFSDIWARPGNIHSEVNAFIPRLIPHLPAIYQLLLDRSLQDETRNPILSALEAIIRNQRAAAIHQKQQTADREREAQRSRISQRAASLRGHFPHSLVVVDETAAPPANEDTLLLAQHTA